MSTSFEERNWMATHSLPEGGPSTLLSFSEEFSRLPLRSKNGIEVTELTTATLTDWAFDAASAYPKWLAQPGFLLQWCPKDLTISAENFSSESSAARNLNELSKSDGYGGALRFGGLIPVLEFGPTTFAHTASSGGGVANIHITGGLLTLATHEPARRKKASCGILSFECRHSSSGEIEFRTALSR